ncbi:hypothetical protein [Candidatus Coxiella mudrowiae]|uniref:hypothetical protein n=1 Tax=Candidatus Coxiella mudrowiae TaxID=2054173 RepID=UPI000C28874D|nr:hypothetical protein [Candidatus Coxiella mudrowiae]
MTDSPVHVSPLLVKFLLVFNELQRYTISEQLESLSNQSETYTVALESVLSELEENKNDKTISYEEKEEYRIIFGKKFIFFANQIVRSDIDLGVTTIDKYFFLLEQVDSLV